MSKVLVVCYSRSGTTRAIGSALAERLDADFEAITEPADRSRPLSYLRCLVDAVFARSVHIDSARHDVAQYDIVVIGTPVWAGTVSAPVRAWLTIHRRHLPHVAFFCTQRMRGDAKTFREMTKVAGKQPVAHCAVTARMDAQEKQRFIEIFADRIKRRLTRIDNLEWAM